MRTRFLSTTFLTVGALVLAQPALAQSAFNGLGDLPGDFFSSEPYGISSDGTTVVGLSQSSNGLEAYLWTLGGGMVGLGDLTGGGFESIAYAANADGSVVVGYSLSANGYEAFRWSSGTGMVGLGDLAGGVFESFANSVNADGSVVVGTSQSINGYEAFRWTSGTGMVGLGDLAGGGFSSYAYGVSADGSVVVGQSDGASGTEAFRWTSGTGMVGLGDLAGGSFFSFANAVSGDGSVVVGASQGASSQEAFRWTQATGMQSVQDWLAGAGVTLPAGWLVLENAMGVSADGTVLVGRGVSANGTEAYIARVSALGAGIIDTVEYAQSLESTGEAVNTVGTQADLYLNGARSTPLLGLVDEGRSLMWTVGDLGSRDREGGNGYQGLAELGYSYGVSKNLQVGLGLGLADGQQDLVFNGSLRQDGLYLAPEVIWQAKPNLYVSLQGYYSQGDTRLRRGYDNGGTPDFSNGSTDVSTAGIRARVDVKDAFSHGNTKFTPNVSYTYIRSELDAFTETGGGFPVAWESYSDSSNTLRVGLDATHALSEETTLLGRMEGAYRFEDRSAGARGEIIGLNAFEAGGASRRQAWVRVGAGAEVAAGQGKASFMLNLSTEGEDRPDVWASVGYRIRF